MIDQILDGGFELKIGGIVGDIIAWWSPIWHAFLAKLKGGKA